jgi:hypothetical protein
MSIVMALGCDFRPKSLLVVLIEVLIYVFHTHFDRGLKVRLFVRHNELDNQSSISGFC